GPGRAGAYPHSLTLTISREMLVGREQELSAVTAVLRAAAGGRGSALVVTGEAGIGKTALLDAAAPAGGCRPLRATGVAAERGVAHATLQALLWPLRGLVDELEPSQRALVGGVLELGPPLEASSFAVGAAGRASRGRRRPPDRARRRFGSPGSVVRRRSSRAGGPTLPACEARAPTRSDAAAGPCRSSSWPRPRRRSRPPRRRHGSCRRRRRSALSCRR